MIEGKTKIIKILSPDEASIFQKDDITAGDGLRHDVIPGKGEITARTAAAVFRYLQRETIPTHFIYFHPPNKMIVRPCTMIPVEVVVRRIPYGSYLKRNPGVSFEEPIVEYFLKDDAHHDPEISYAEFEKVTPHAYKIPAVALTVCELLADAWLRQGITLIDLKLEFGVWKSGLLVADDISNDHWRIRTADGRLLDKQVYRDNPNPDLELIRSNYALVADMVEKF
jgi:phosphoribosylaminoimidazole-succinocarboxamide synthase